jgi:hypothetical protein
VAVGVKIHDLADPDFHRIASVQTVFTVINGVFIDPAFQQFALAAGKSDGKDFYLSTFNLNGKMDSVFRLCVCVRFIEQAL